MMNAIATASECAVVIAMEIGSRSNNGNTIEASAGSPIQPRPRLAIVMPSWVAAMN